ncbi:MAG: phytoene desaturase family protein [Fimbriiglobus sp.]
MSTAAPLISTPTRTTSSRAPKSVIIVGAGPGGLAAAMLLAQAGVQVRVVERLPKVGGRCSSIQEQGYRFDLGPTFFLYPRVLERIYGLLGKDLHREIPMVKLDPQYRVIFGDQGGDLLCTPNLDQMATAVAKLNPQDGENVKRFISENRVKLERFRPALESPFLSWRDLISWDLVKLLPLLRPWKSVEGELNRYFTDPRTRLAFSFQSKYLGMSPFNCPSLFTILSYLEYDYGVWHPIGGCNAVSEGMAKTARELGATISLNEPVTELIFEGKKAIGVKTTEGSYKADAVIMNADFAQSMKKLVPNKLRARWTDEKLAKKRYSCSTYMLYLGLEGRYDHLHHHTIYTSSDYLGNLEDIEKNQQLSPDPSFYVQNASITDETLAPKGHSALYVLVPVPHQNANIDWDKEKPLFREKVFQQLKKVGLDDIQSRIRFEKIVTPADWENQYEVYRGATFNLAHNLMQMLHLRPRNRFEDLGNVYLVGGGTHPGSGLPVIYESARITSRLLLQDFGMDAAWLGVPGAKDETPISAPVA